jgi:hypothetical protein
VWRLVYGLLVLTFGCAALAGERYVEVWNPPVAHIPQTTYGIKTGKKSGRKTVKRCPVVARAGNPLAQRSHSSRVRVKTSPVPPVAPAYPAATSAPAFETIPRQITPEGNVLRVRNSVTTLVIER